MYHTVMSLSDELKLHSYSSWTTRPWNSGEKSNHYKYMSLTLKHSANVVQLKRLLLCVRPHFNLDYCRALLLKIQYRGKVLQKHWTDQSFDTLETVATIQFVGQNHLAHR